MTETPDPAAEGFAGLHRRELPGMAGAILGASHGTPYVHGERSHAAGAPAAIRAAAGIFTKQLQQYDFDIDATWSKAWLAAATDLGDIPTDPADPVGNRAAITASVRRVLDAGAVPILIGGDDSVPIPAFGAYEAQGPLTIVQVDAHVDWGDVVRKNPLGFGSTMRRASELPWITGMVQVGMRGLGSGTPDQIAAARAWGSRIVTAREFRRMGPEAVAGLIPEGGAVLLSIDCDGLDPAVLPGVNMPTPGGPDMQELTALLQALARRGRIAGCNVVELAPERDPTERSALVAARIVLTVLGLVCRQRSV